MTTYHTVAVRLSEEEFESLQDRVKYLQTQRPGSKITMSDAIRQALYISCTCERNDNAE